MRNCGALWLRVLFFFSVFVASWLSLGDCDEYDCFTNLFFFDCEYLRCVTFSTEPTIIWKGEIVRSVGFFAFVVMLLLYEQSRS